MTIIHRYAPVAYGAVGMLLVLLPFHVSFA